MQAIEMIKGRRSIRKFKDEKVDREVMKEILDMSRYAPSWANFQVARYTIVDDKEVIDKLAGSSVNDFIYNINVLKEAKGVAVLSYVQGKSGTVPDTGGYVTNKENTWEVFDAGIACQTFCLSAHAKGVGTVIMGIINDEEISKVINLPEDQTVAALIVFGYPDETPNINPRMSAEEISRFI